MNLKAIDLTSGKENTEFKTTDNIANAIKENNEIYKVIKTQRAFSPAALFKSPVRIENSYFS